MRSRTCFKRLFLSVSSAAITAATAVPAFAQAPAPAPTPEACAKVTDDVQRQACAQAATQVDPLANQGEASPSQGPASAEGTQTSRAITITGSRLRRDERSSADPVTIIDPNVQARQGRFDTAEILQASPVAQGSTQVTSTLSSNFVFNGGSGVETLSLRGLGANRTLVLLNGRRAGPAGTRGGVSAFDLNVIPGDAIQTVDILKTGASSIYGSDAIAGVVNLITKKDVRGLSARVFTSIPARQGGDELDVSALYGIGLGSRGHLMIGVDYYKQRALRRGDRDFLGCEEENIRSEATGARADPIDPRTGKPYCGDFANNQIFLTDLVAGGLAPGPTNLLGPLVPTATGFTRRPIGQIQFATAGNRLADFLSPITPAINEFQFTAPAGFFPVGNYSATGLALANDYDPRKDDDSIKPRTTRFTVYGEGGYDLTDDISLYFEGLYNRRKSKTIDHGQLFFYQFPGTSPTAYTNDYGIYTPYFFCSRGGVGIGDDTSCDPNAVGDPINAGFSGTALLEPVITRPFSRTADVKYMRGVAGIRGNLERLLPHGFFDFYVQGSRSNGDYSQEITFRDAIEFGVAQYRTNRCAGTVTAIRGVPCIDINYTDPRVLAGNFTPEEQAFLFGVDRGNTRYKQNSAELTFGGDIFKLPAGAVKAALGADWRWDKIRDVPGEYTLTDNVFGSITSGITAGRQITTEAFGELEVPVLKNGFLAKELTINGAARITNATARRQSDGLTDKDKNNWTYKVGLNYLPTDWLRLRATYGTSFRSPALFEQFLANESGFQRQGAIDPCIQYGLSDNAELRANCAAQGIPANYLGTGASAEVFSGGGIGRLNPEKSKAITLGFVLTPGGWLWRDGQFSFAVDYVDINVRDQVTQLGPQNILNGCYTSDSFPTDPLCSLFTRAPATAANKFNVISVSDPYLNIDQERNKSLDFTLRYRQKMGTLGSLSLVAQATYQLKDRFTLFEGTTQSFNGEVGDPKWVGDLTMSWTKGLFTATYGLNVIAGTNDIRTLRDIGGTGLTANNCLATASAYAIRGGPYCPVYKLPRVAYHSLSAEIQATKDVSFLIGVANLTNRKPPLISTVGTPIQGIGQVPVAASYYDYVGRRVFLTARAKLGGLFGR